MIKKILRFTAVYALFKTLFGYLDPGSGSLIIQLLIALAVGLVGTFALFRQRILEMLGLRKRQENLLDEDDEDGIAQEEQK